MNSVLRNRKDLVQVIAGDDQVTIRLPYRTLDDTAVVTNRLRKVQDRDRYVMVAIAAGLIAITVTVPIEYLMFTFLAIAPMVLLCAGMIIRVRRLNLAAVQQQQTQVDVRIRSGEVRVRERTAYRNRWFYRIFWANHKRIDPLGVGRMRIERTCVLEYGNMRAPDHYDNRVPVEPYLWPFLNEIDYSLVADDHDGRVLTVLAHAYPRDVLTDAARKLKHQLDSYRVAHDQQLAVIRPDIRLPDYGDGIPICLGPRLREPKRKPKHPASTNITLVRRNRETVISVPRGEELEAVEFRANSHSLSVTRKLLLGEIQHVIESEHLRKIYVRFEEMPYSDDVRLIIEYFDPKSRSSEILAMLQNFRTDEICWVAAELREACPPTGDDEVETTESRFQYSIAHLLYGTTLVCVFFACASSISPWGWIFGIQAVAVILCITSFTGIRLLAPYTNRSWTRTEIIFACAIAGASCFAWWLRYTSS